MIADVVFLFLDFLTIAIFARIILSFVIMFAPTMRWLLYHPIGRAIDAVTEPILGPIRSVLPSFGGFDFSPMIALIIFRVIRGIVAGSI